ncbi:aldo/keto reductase [Pseudodonghicola flavimaris]|uniref:Aldo/keto reductase n=1 Tax=Pseudodonghicola flavimaris TaxID=3050036 RepID=A0ABT7F342_9RHOB|nr:aldo/keto reductase [Pseudodonghicola flavimaris]MDK3019042.1 aldo/keto reductase [Pseudodonghicola flavimaris]
MLMRKMGASGPEISALGVGAMSFSNFYGPTNEAESHAILAAAQDLGITHIDTANIYGMGRSETVIGTFFKANPGARDGFHIATKAGITKDEDGTRCFKNSLEHLEAELDASLARMGIDCVDLMYIHRRQADMPIEEAAGNLARLVEKGKAKSIGFSEIAPSSLRRAASVHPIAAVQSEYSLSTRAPELGLVQACAELGTALVAFSPVGRSLLTDTPIPREVVPTLAFAANNPRFMEPNLTFNLEITEGFRKLAAEMGTSAAALSIAWLIHQGDHVIPIPGTRSVDHFRQLVAGCDLTLSAADLARIEEVLPLGWCHGDRYNEVQWVGPERFC